MMNPETSGGASVDPRIELIAQRVQQLQQMVAAGGHSHGDIGSDHHNEMMKNVLERMRLFMEKQADGVDSIPEKQAKVNQVLNMIKQVQSGMGMAIPLGDGTSAKAGGTGLEGLPLNRDSHCSDPEYPPDPVEVEKHKLALMSGDISTTAPHRDGNWIRCPSDSSQGPVDSLLYGSGHYTPPVFGWGELVKESDAKVKKSFLGQEMFKTSTAFMMPHETATSGRVLRKTLPIVGRIRFLTDVQGLLCWSVVVLYWILGNYSTWFCILLPQYTDGNLSIVWLIAYAIVSLLCISSHLRASTMNPGKIPYYVPKDSVDHPDWSYCDQCEQKRPPRAHHCRRCQQCVLKMDHHCPWINNCVGENNQWAFMLLIIYAQLLSCFSLAFNILWYWYMPQCVKCDPRSFPIFHQQFFIGTVTGMAVLMIVFSMSLICSQNVGILVDFTTLEWMHLERQVSITGKMPDAKDMPKMRGNLYRKYHQLCGDTLCLFWLFPCRQRVAPVVKNVEAV